MPTFQFEAMDATGQEIKDVIEAPNQDEAQATIRQMGYFVTKITVKKSRGAAEKKKGAKGRKTFALGRVGSKKLTTFTRQLSILQDAGLPILRSLRILEQQQKPGMLRGAEAKDYLSKKIPDLENADKLLAQARPLAQKKDKSSLEQARGLIQQVIAMGGPSASGKTTLAARLAAYLVDAQAKFPRNGALWLAPDEHPHTQLALAGRQLMPQLGKVQGDGVVKAAVRAALKAAQAQKIVGKEVTPFLLSKVSELTGGTSLRANLGLLLNNANVASQIARALARMEREGVS